MLKLHTNQLVIWFMQVHVNNFDLLVTRPSPHPEALACPSTLELLQIKECAPTLYPSIIFTFRFTIESTKEFGGVSSKALSWREFKVGCSKTT